MTQTIPQLVLVAFVVFSRIGACIMVAPGFSSPRITVQSRLFMALGLALSLTPLLEDEIGAQVSAGDPLTLFRIMTSELLTGAMIGLMANFYFIALETIAQAISMSVGLSSNLGVALEGNEDLPAVATLLMLSATVLLFVTDQHLVLFRGLADSYKAMPVHDGFMPRFAMTQLADAAGQAFMLALRIGSPFLIFSLILNFALGLMNRLVPAVHTFFLSQPFLLLGGLGLLLLTIKPMLERFLETFSHFLATGGG